MAKFRDTFPHGPPKTKHESGWKSARAEIRNLIPQFTLGGHDMRRPRMSLWFQDGLSTAEVTMRSGHESSRVVQLHYALRVEGAADLESPMVQIARWLHSATTAIPRPIQRVIACLTENNTAREALMACDEPRPFTQLKMMRQHLGRNRLLNGRENTRDALRRLKLQRCGFLGNCE